MRKKLALLLALATYPLAGQELLIAAAADLTPLESHLSAVFYATAGIRVRFSFGSSGMLARQIRYGAPFDLYLSANQQYVDQLASDGVLDRTTVAAYATGRLGLWSVSGKVRETRQLLAPEIRFVAIANPTHAPYGVAAEELLRTEGLWDRLQSKLVLGENVRQAFDFAQTGNADAVITSWTLLLNQNAVPLPEAEHKPIRQWGAVVRKAKNAAAARRFLAFLLSPAGQGILREGGLFPPR
jgi:molybdate transport system substrate-binding protein